MKQLKTYDCGVRLISEYVPGKKVANISFFVASGSGYDLKNKEGIAHYFEHMFFKSTKNRSSKQLLQEMDKLGGMNNAYTSHDKTCYYGKVISDDAEKFFEMLSDCFFNGLFVDGEMQTEKGVVCSEIDKYEDDFMDCCMDALNKDMFDGTNFAHPILGSKASVMSITADDLKEYRAKNNGPGKLIISVFGGVPFEKADELVQKYVLPNYRTKEEPIIYANQKLYVPQPKSNVVFTKKDTKQVYFLTSTPTIRVGDPDYLKLQIASIMFGGSMSSRLFERMREKEGIVYYINSALSTLALCGCYNASFITEKSSAEKALKAYYDEVQRIINDGFSEKEFQNALHMLKTNTIMRDDDIDVKAFRDASSYLYTGKLYDAEKVIEEANSIKLDDLNKAFANLLKKESFCSIVMKEEDKKILDLLK